MIFKISFCVIFSLVAADSNLYHSFYGHRLTKEEVLQLQRHNTTFWCMTEIDSSCQLEEFRRLDGSCNNLRKPARGTPHTPFTRILPAVHNENYYLLANLKPRTTKSGNPLPLSRHVRTKLLLDGRRPNQEFTMLLTHFWLFMVSDVVTFEESVSFTPTCCKTSNKGSRRNDKCLPNRVPNDDPVLRFSKIRCLHMTRPYTYQDAKCINVTQDPERVTCATPAFDASMLYGTSMKELSKEYRTYQGGRLKFESQNSQTWPPSQTHDEPNNCVLNQIPETRCHAGPDGSVNTILGINLNFIWFWRYHNKVARKLARINRCWSDKMLFFTARDIVIAVLNQIYLYELLAAVFGRHNLEKDGALSTDKLYRDIYDDNLYPEVSVEYLYALRWVHTIQEGTVKMYDRNGDYVKQIPITNLTLRTGYLAIGNNMEMITQGAFRQGCAAMDFIVDPTISEIGLGPLQKAYDITTNDHAKGRYFGMAPYVQYINRCFGVVVRTFDDLLPLIDPERIEILKEMYKSVEDIELMSGIWLENPIDNGFVPSTVYCLVIEQIKRSAKADRHWYESSTRPFAFTEYQLTEIRKISIARILCDVGNGVFEIQPHAFRRIGKENQITDCKNIPKINFEAWQDQRCQNVVSKHKH